MIYGYARVSTKGQSLERQEQSILKAVPDIQERYFFKDKYTGKDFESRPAFNELKKKIDEIKEINPQAKIRLTVHEIDRLGRDYNELLKEFIDLSEKGVVLNALDIPKEIAEQTGVAGNLVYMILILYKSAILCLNRLWDIYSKKGTKIIICTVGAGYSIIVQLYEF